MFISSMLTSSSNTQFAVDDTDDVVCDIVRCFLFDEDDDDDDDKSDIS